MHDDRQGMVHIVMNTIARLLLNFTDNYSGVESENLTKIFDINVSNRPARTKVSYNFRFSLAVCKQIVELHGGLILVQ